MHLDRPVGADQLEEVALGHVDSGVELDEDVAREAHRAREQKIDAVAVQALLAVDALRLPGDETREMHAVTPDIHESAALEVCEQSHVAGLLDGEALGGPDQPQRTDGPSCSSDLIATVWGWWRYMNASARIRPGPVQRGEILIPVLGLTEVDRAPATGHLQAKTLELACCASSSGSRMRYEAPRVHRHHAAAPGQ